MAVEFHDRNANDDCYWQDGEVFCRCCCQTSCETCSNSFNESLAIVVGFGPLDER